MTSYILKTDGTKIPITPKNGKDFKCAEIHEHLRTEDNTCPCFTIVRLNNDRLMLVEDNGFSLGLKYNEIATFEYANAGGNDPIFGQVLVFPSKMLK